MPARRVLSVGQCFADHGSIARTFRQHLGAEVVPAATADEALGRVREGAWDLVLVNRVLDADGTSGVEFIKRLKAEGALGGVPVVLVSNYEDAQRQAAEAGALPGFGKAALGQPHMLARVRALLEGPPG
jgi:DNA-binding response OmpR family regulator